MSEITYLHNLAPALKQQVQDVHWDAFKEKLIPILGDDERAKRLLYGSLSRDNCIIAVHNRTAVGVIGLKTATEGFHNMNMRRVVASYGLFGGLVRGLALMIMDYKPKPDEVYIDCAAVAPHMRGQGVGGGLFAELDKMVALRQYRTISLHVVDTNPRAMKLYQSLGFAPQKEVSIKPFDRWLKLPFSKMTLMVKTVAHPNG